MTWELSFTFRSRAKHQGYASSPILPSCKACFNHNINIFSDVQKNWWLSIRLRRTFLYGMYLVLLMSGSYTNLRIKVSSFLLPFECSSLFSPRWGSCCTSGHASTSLSAYFASYVACMSRSDTSLRRIRRMSMRAIIRGCLPAQVDVKSRGVDYCRSSFRLGTS